MPDPTSESGVARPDLGTLVARLEDIKDRAGSFNQRNLTDACLRLNRIEDWARECLTALRAQAVDGGTEAQKAAIATAVQMAQRLQADNVRLRAGLEKVQVRLGSASVCALRSNLHAGINETLAITAAALAGTGDLLTPDERTDVEDYRSHPREFHLRPGGHQRMMTMLDRLAPPPRDTPECPMCRGDARKVIDGVVLGLCVMCDGRGTPEGE